MIPTLKPFAARATSLKLNEFSKATLRLTIYYVAGIFTLLVISSVTIYLVFTSGTTLVGELTVAGDGLHNEFSLSELQENLADIIVIVNFGILVIFAVSAYFFARHTLDPIKVMYQKQERFVGDVAHELRTPLTVMKSGAEAILRQPRTVSEYTDFIKESLEETDRMNRLTNELLFLLTETTAPTKQFERVDISALITEQVKQYASYATEKKIALKSQLAAGLLLSVIPDSFVRLLRNLIKNAIDYNRPNGEVTVGLAKSSDGITITVTDTGIGMNEEDTKQVFERFYKTDTSRKRHNMIGTGLGLSIVKEIVDAHGGTIAISSKIDVGTTVIINLPDRHFEDS